MSEIPIYKILLIRLFASTIVNTKKNSKNSKKYRIHSFKQDNKINIKFIYYGFMLMKLNVIRYKGKMSQRNREYRIKNKLCLYCGKLNY